MKKIALVLTLLLGAASVFLYIQQATPSFIGTDAYYHSQLAKLMGEAGIASWPIPFPWLPSTVLSEERFSDHHFLFHVALIPFIAIGGVLAAKWAAVLFATLVFGAFLFALPSRRGELLLLGAVFFFAQSSAFLYRMSMVRAQSLSLVLLLILSVLLVRRHYRVLTLASAIYVWLYNAFPLVLLLLVCYLIAEAVSSRRLDVKAIVAVVVGLMVGLIINPYFPANVVFLYHHLVDKFAIERFAVRVGKEWYPYGSSSLLTHAVVPTLLFGIALGAAAISSTRLRVSSILYLLMTVLTLGMLLRSRRFIELYPVFALLSFFWCMADVASGPTIERLRSNMFTTWRERAVGSLAFLVLLGIATTTVWSSAEKVEDSVSYNRYRTSAEWIARNSEPGEMVCNADWDDFPRLFHFNAHNRYLVGLDPYFLFARNQTDFKLWKSATSGELLETPAHALYRRFGTRWFFLDRKHERFRRQLRKEKGVRLAFDGGDSYVYELLLEQ